jgi:hypothetical protein
MLLKQVEQVMMRIANSETKAAHNPSASKIASQSGSGVSPLQLRGETPRLLSCVIGCAPAHEGLLRK